MSTSTRPGRATPRRRPILVAASAVAVVGAVAAWAVAGRDGGSSPGPPTGIAHVHGLGVDPGDGTLYVATHYGVFQMADDGATAQRIGRIQDTMGFTVVGTGHFLGSGHPGEQDGRPPLLGLIESTDAAATWQDLSLSGEVDFHALAYAHDQVYGWDATSSELMVSTDRRTWDTRSTLPLFGFAVDPGDPERIVATTPDGVQQSTDGGRRWQPLDGAPELGLVTWSSTTGLWGLDAAGTTYHASGTGSDLVWESAGTLVGPPQALLADGDTLYAAATDPAGVTGIYQSTDSGATWQTRYRDEG